MTATSDKLTKKYNQLISDWEKYLKPHGVTKPPKQGTKGYWFYLYAYMHLGQPITGKDVVEFAKLHGESISEDSQILRHMSNVNGWNARSSRGIMPDGTTLRRGQYSLLDAKTVLPRWSKTKRDAVSSGDWEEIKKRYDYRCACCGSKEGEPNNKDSRKITKLEKGHMDPSKSLNDNNMIPQCESCNKPYLDRVVFDENGFVCALNNSHLVMKSSLEVKRKILTDLLSDGVTPY